MSIFEEITEALQRMPPGQAREVAISTGYFPILEREKERQEAKRDPYAVDKFHDDRTFMGLPLVVDPKLAVPWEVRTEETFKEPPELLARLDALREFLKAERAKGEGMPGSRSARWIAEVDLHLATVDDACEALQIVPAAETPKFTARWDYSREEVARMLGTAPGRVRLLPGGRWEVLD